MRRVPTAPPVDWPLLLPIVFGIVMPIIVFAMMITFGSVVLSTSVPPPPMELRALNAGVDVDVLGNVSFAEGAVTFEKPQSFDVVLPVDLHPFGGGCVLSSTKQICDPTLPDAQVPSSWKASKRSDVDRQKNITNPHCFKEGTTTLLTAVMQHLKAQALFPPHFGQVHTYLPEASVEQKIPNRRARIVNHTVSELHGA
jgi:hypothetical protein